MNGDFDTFRNEKFRYMRAIDEKYVHELSKDKFEMDMTDFDGDVQKLRELDFEDVAQILQKLNAKDRNLNYRRKKYVIKRT